MLHEFTAQKVSYEAGVARYRDTAALAECYKVAALNCANKLSL